MPCPREDEVSPGYRDSFEPERTGVNWGALLGVGACLAVWAGFAYLAWEWMTR